MEGMALQLLVLQILEAEVVEQERDQTVQQMERLVVLV
jgi:hypothetical protein